MYNVVDVLVASSESMAEALELAEDARLISEAQMSGMVTRLDALDWGLREAKLSLDRSVLRLDSDIDQARTDLHKMIFKISEVRPCPSTPPPLRSLSVLRPPHPLAPTRAGGWPSARRRLLCALCVLNCSCSVAPSLRRSR